MKTWPKYLRDLANSLPVLTGNQALTHYFQNSKNKMLRVLRSHEAAGLITLSTEISRQREPVSGPITIVKVGDLSPDPEAIAYAGRQRWSDRVTPVIVIRSTAKLHGLFGGELRKIVSANLSHEIALTGLLLQKREALGADFQWTLVPTRPGTGPLPDVITAGGCIELIGRYNATQVACKLTLAGRINLEIW